jgi:cytochrome c-type biogenesis protein
MESTELNFALAFATGFLTFFTPCFLPLLPAYLSFITGLSFNQLSEEGRSKRAVVINSLFFILGFTLVFVLLGASITYLGSLLYEYKAAVRTVGGSLIIVFGLYLLGLFRVGFFERERKFHLRSRPAGFMGSLLIGAAFAAGWTPCVGPILGSILVYAGASETLRTGMFMLVFYSLGLAVPFFLSALLVNVVLKRIGKLSKYIRYFSIACGILLICMGILLITDPFHLLRKF